MWIIVATLSVAFLFWIGLKVRRVSRAIESLKLDDQALQVEIRLLRLDCSINAVQAEIRALQEEIRREIEGGVRGQLAVTPTH